MTKLVKDIAYPQYPISSILIYNGVTFLHYILGFMGILYALDFSSTAKIIALLYAAFAFFQMYILMPIIVCPNCPYTQKSGMLCISGLNQISRLLFPLGDINKFMDRSKGILCHNNLYMAAKIIPLFIMLPFLFMNFSPILLILFLSVLGLMLFRVFYLFRRIACNHCLAKNICPNANSMGLSNV